MTFVDFLNSWFTGNNLALLGAVRVGERRMLGGIDAPVAAREDGDGARFDGGRGVVVNLEHAEDFEDASFRMADGSRVYVSQELLKSARQVFMEFLLQGGRAL